MAACSRRDFGDLLSPLANPARESIESDVIRPVKGVIVNATAALADHPGRDNGRPASHDPGILQGMTELTTIKVPVSLRDRLKAYAEVDGRTLAAELEYLLDQRDEAEFWASAHAASDRLFADDDAAAAYLAEAEIWEQTSADGLESAAEEWPEFNKPRSA